MSNQASDFSVPSDFSLKYRFELSSLVPLSVTTPIPPVVSSKFHLETIFLCYFFIDTLGCSYQTASLKFRDHPLITLRNGVKAWPPEWITASGNTTTGEVGILEYVSVGLLIDTTFFLFIGYQHCGIDVFR